jgi:hypothetical protein
MNACKFARKEAELTTTARKVFGAIPAEDAWGKEKIISELFRQGVSLAKNIVEGCIESLKEDGLVKEPRLGQYTRTKVSELDRTEAIPKEAFVATQYTPATLKPQDEKADVLTAIAALSAQLRETADKLDGIALDVEERFQRLAKDNEKLTQLQALLKSINQP